MYCHSDFTRGILVLKQRMKQKTALGMLVPSAAGIVSFALLSLLTAYAVHAGYLPTELIRPAALVALALASVLSGMLCGGEGKRGILTGTLLCVLYLIWKLTASSDNSLSVYTLIGCGITLLCPFAASCIFHKKRRGYTRRNQRNGSRK